MTIKVVDLLTSSKMETISVRVTYQTSQSPLNAPSGKNSAGHEIMNQPQISSPECECLLLMRVISFNSIPQLFQFVDQGFQHHIDFWSKMVWTRYDEAKKHKFMLYAKGRRKLYGIANMGQQEYDVALSPQGVKPSVASPMRTFLASRANYGLKLSKAFHMSESEGCTITSLFSLSPSLCHMNHGSL
jgi:hypothetical protein